MQEIALRFAHIQERLKGAALRAGMRPEDKPLRWRDVVIVERLIPLNLT